MFIAFNVLFRKIGIISIEENNNTSYSASEVVPIKKLAIIKIPVPPTEDIPLKNNAVLPDSIPLATSLVTQ